MNQKQEITSLPNLYGNPIASIDIETTGRVGGYHEMIQIAIVPLNMDLEIADDIIPFYHTLKPEYPDRVERAAEGVHGLNIDNLIVNSPDQEKVSEYLVDWVSNLPLGTGRRLTPLAHNWAFERSFLLPWLGPDLMNAIFTPLPRDTMTFALSLNDRASLIGMKPVFNRVNLGAMCRYFGIELHDAHDALADAIATAKLYSAMLRAMS